MPKNFEHLTCDKCGGIIGSYDRGNVCTCERCGKEFPFHTLTYDESLRIEDAIANILKKDEENVELASQEIVDW